MPKADQQRNCPHCAINQSIESVLGADRSGWPIPGAIAVPVEMLESWQLLICNAEKYQSEQRLPLFAHKKKSAAKAYYTSTNVPDQLKDLVRDERQKFATTREFCRYCADRLDVGDLKVRSPSFTQFANQVKDW
ncbi:MAG: hypothetical protein AAFP03_03135 [Cyanobacteria bacterium J06598_3]